MYNFAGASELLLNLCVVVIGTLVLELFYPMVKAPWLRSTFMPAVITSEMALCMSIPFTEVDGFTFDLRAVPMIVGPLYGGISTSVTMVAVYLFCRIMIGGPQVFTGLSIGLPLILISWALSLVYGPQSRTTKILTGSIPLLLLLSVLDPLLFGHLRNHPHLASTLLLYDLVNLLLLWVTILAVESVHANESLIDEIRRAEKLSVLGELAASIAHEIRNPLTASRGFVQLTMESLSLSTAENSYLRMAIDEMDRTHEIINDYLSLAKPESDVYRELLLDLEVQHVAEMLTPYANMSNVNIDLELHGNSIVYGSPQKVTRMLVNITKNAIQAMPRGGNLTVKTSQNKEFAVVQITDTGVGMTTATIRHLGEPFYSTKRTGTGLGLLISYRYCQSMNGKIKVTSTLDKGTTFEVSLPLHSPA